MNHDLRELLASWPYDSTNPENNYRRLTGEDHRMILQVREPLGIQQMEYEGRPDGFRPHGRGSWLEYYQNLAEGHSSFTLTDEDCQNLIQEGILYYQRYLILYQMNDWEGVARDTGRNLEYFDFLKTHVREAAHSLMVEQYRPYVMRMNAIARAWILWREGAHDEALTLLKRTLRDLAQLEEIPTEVFKMERQRSTKHIREVLEEFEKRRPESEAELLRKELRQAILSEQFEVAARIRDRLKSLEQGCVSQS